MGIQSITLQYPLDTKHFINLLSCLNDFEDVVNESRRRRGSQYVCLWLCNTLFLLLYYAE